jgi:hypothetical protein
MGCFNTSCFASRQTIAPGEKCYVMPIIQRHGFHAVEVTHGEAVSEEWGLTDSVCYPNGFWRAMSGFIEATYDDYGRFKVTNTPRNGYLMFHFIGTLYKSAGVVEQGSNRYHDVPYNLPGFIKETTPLLHAMLSERGSEVSASDREVAFEELVKVWDYTWEAAQEHRLFAVSRYGSCMRPVQFAVLHGESYNQLVALTSKGRTWDKVPFEPRAYFEDMLRKVQTDMDEFFREELEELKAPHGADTAESLLQEHAKLDVSKRLMTVSRFLEEFSLLASFERALSQVDMVGLRSSVKRHLENELSLDALFEKALPFMKDRYALSALEDLNLYLSPMVYAGQDYSNDIGTMYTRFVQDVSKAVNLGRNRDEDDEDEETEE